MMASSSSSSSGGRCKYDVFLSFRGEDTRRNFVCHLYKALEQKAIHTFIDSEELKKGNKISELLNFIDESSISIVVLSQNYASSTWCLKELVKILDCMDMKKQMVVPIFYEVDPSDIRKLKKEFGKAFAKHEENAYAAQKELETWKTALTRIADLSGWDSRQYKDDFELIEKVVGDIIEKWIHIPRSSSLANNLVGMDHHIKEVSLRLCRGKNDVGVVGIWGMGGIGKTTIARAVYDKIAHQFEHKCFFSNVKERFPKKDEAQMRGELLSMILKGNVQSVDIFNEGSNAILERLGKKKVLVVLDDVETFSQIEALLGDFYSFGVGSRILVTTRDKGSLAAAGVYETYEPRCLNHNESLELFMKHAFRTNQPSKEYSDLSDQAIEYAQGLPLALKVLGASLYKKSIDQWKELLEKIKKIPERKIMDVLRTSFEGLDDQEKDIFLDIACFFREWDKDFVTQLLDSCGFFPRNGLRVLVDRALITTSHSKNKLDMHDLVQDMGRGIVRLESIKEPGKLSRLWSYEDVHHVLTQNTATDAVECIVLDLLNSKVDLCINTEAFVRMTNLRVLVICYSLIPMFNFARCWPRYITRPVGRCKQLTRGEFEFLSYELKCLIWHECPLKSLPSTYIPKNLVKLDMLGSHIRELWKGIQPLQNLKVISLSHSQYLVKIPDLTEAINLEKLLLNGCSSLLEVHPSIFALQNLDFLNLEGCKQLKILPSSIHMNSLKTLVLSGCSNIEKFPEISEVMSELTGLSLGGTAIKELPSSIKNLTGLRTLNLEGCTELKTLPELNLEGDGCLPEFCLDEMAIYGLPSSIDLLLGLSMPNYKSLEFLPNSICNLAYLTHLNLTGCTGLKTLSTSIHMRSLHTLNLNGCSNLEKFPEISGIMKELPELCLDGTAIKGLPSSIDLLLGIKKLSMRNCKSLEFLPDSISNLAYLTHLDLTGCTALTTLPTSIHMRSLQTLDLDGCSNLEKFPEISGIMKELPELCLDGTAIKGLPSSIDLLLGIKKLSMRNCKSLEFLPDSICNLADLTHLDLTCCTELKTLPTSIHMRSLHTLNLDGCSNLEKFPEISGIMKELPERCLDGTAIKGLPSSIDLLLGIEHLRMRDCKSLEFLPDSISNLAYLTHLDLTGCTALTTLPTSIHMRSLQTLYLDGCSNLEKFPEISGIMEELPELCLDGTAIKGLPSSIDLLLGIEHLSMRDCKSLEFLPDSISNLAYLTHLDLTGCTALTTLPTSIHMRSLQTLDLDGCSNLEKFPEISGIMKELSVLGLDGTAIKGLPSSIDLLVGLEHLSMRDCKSLEFLPDSVCNLAYLTHLNLYGCSVLHNLPEKLGDLESLQVLDVSYSGIKQLPFSTLRLSAMLSCIGCNEMAASLSAWSSSMEKYCTYSVLVHLDLSDCNLLELSDGIAHLSSLKTLKLCRNNLESLPVIMNRLVCLTRLELEACKRLKSIPELSSSIKYIDAHDCTALQKVSKPKPQYQTDHFFTFSNCLQLVQTNLFTDIVERHSHLQGSYLRPLQLKMSLPGSEVPDWFNHQRRGFSVCVQLPPNWFGSQFLGFAICAVRKCQRLNDHTNCFSAYCVCTFRGNRGECSFSFDMLDSMFRNNRYFRSDHMFLGYVSWSDHMFLLEEGELANEAYTEATFQIEVVSEGITQQPHIRSCGVRFVYANPDEMLNLNMPQPQVHGHINENRKRRKVFGNGEISELGSHDGAEFTERRQRRERFDRGGVIGRKRVVR